MWSEIVSCRFNPLREEGCSKAAASPPPRPFETAYAAPLEPRSASQPIKGEGDPCGASFISPPPGGEGLGVGGHTETQRLTPSLALPPQGGGKSLRQSAYKTRPADNPREGRTRFGKNKNTTRDYYTIEDETSHRYWVFRDGLYGADGGPSTPHWYLHGFFG